MQGFPLQKFAYVPHSNELLENFLTQGKILSSVASHEVLLKALQNKGLFFILTSCCFLWVKTSNSLSTIAIWYRGRTQESTTIRSFNSLVCPMAWCTLKFKFPVALTWWEMQTRGAFLSSKGYWLWGRHSSKETRITLMGFFNKDHQVWMDTFGWIAGPRGTIVTGRAWDNERRI